MTDRDEALASAREAGFIPNFSTFICDEEDIARLIALARRELQAENEALRKDAERYRWLRDTFATGTPHVAELVSTGFCDEIEYLHGDAMDAAIDAAIDAALSAGNKD